MYFKIYNFFEIQSLNPIWSEWHIIICKMFKNHYKLNILWYSEYDIGNSNLESSENLSEKDFGTRQIQFDKFYPVEIIQSTFCWCKLISSAF